MTAKADDTAALYQALGGGWWSRPQTTADTCDHCNDPLKTSASSKGHQEAP